MTATDAEKIAAMIKATADGHLRRDIKGDYAHRSWYQLADAIRQDLVDTSDDPPERRLISPA